MSRRRQTWAMSPDHQEVAGELESPDHLQLVRGSASTPWAPARRAVACTVPVAPCRHQVVQGPCSSIPMGTVSRSSRRHQAQVEGPVRCPSPGGGAGHHSGPARAKRRSLLRLGLLAQAGRRRGRGQPLSPSNSAQGGACGVSGWPTAPCGQAEPGRGWAEGTLLWLRRRCPIPPPVRRASAPLRAVSSGSPWSHNSTATLARPERARPTFASSKGEAARGPASINRGGNRPLPDTP